MQKEDRITYARNRTMTQLSNGRRYSPKICDFEDVDEAEIAVFNRLGEYEDTGLYYRRRSARARGLPQRWREKAAYPVGGRLNGPKRDDGFQDARWADVGYLKEFEENDTNDVTMFDLIGVSV